VGKLYENKVFEELDNMRHKGQNTDQKREKKLDFTLLNGDFSESLKAGKTGSGSERDQCGFKTAMVWWYDL
jgi:hypothetical protein